MSDGGRNLIGRRTESDRTANGIQSDGGRNPMMEIVVLGYRSCGVVLIIIMCRGNWCEKGVDLPMKSCTL